MNYGPYACAGIGALCGLLGAPNENGLLMTIGGLTTLLLHYMASRIMQ